MALWLFDPVFNTKVMYCVKESLYCTLCTQGDVMSSVFIK